MEIYKVKNLSYTRNKKEILKNISFNVEAAKIFGIIGNNGVGKSTLLNLLSGILDIERGKVFFIQKDIAEFPMSLKAKSAMVCDDSTLYQNLSVADNINYISTLSDAKDGLVADLISIFNLRAFLNYRVSKLSTGFKQRLRIVIALLFEPEVILFDEPWNGLDYPGATLLTENIKTLRDEYKKTILVASHDLLLMQNLCDDIIIMKEGRIIEHLHLNTLSEKGLRVILIKDNFNSREFVKNYQGTLHLTDDGFMLVENKNFALRLDNLDYHEDILPLDKLYLKLINSNTYDIPF
jgi:ABC-type multidrug transport system ATPase subunit